MELTIILKEFWTGSILERPKDGRDLVCHASAWDFYNGRDFRIKQCTDINQDGLKIGKTVKKSTRKHPNLKYLFHLAMHEMGHVQYFMSYRNHSYLHRFAPDTALHEAVADMSTLAMGNIYPGIVRLT